MIKLKVMIYSKKNVTPQQIVDMQVEILKKSKLNVGDTVKLKGDEFSPKMVISSKTVKTRNDYNLGTDEMYVQYETQWFNKSRQDFTTKWFIGECLEKL